MANFSTNQVKHFYVAEAVDSNLDTKGDVKFTKVDGDLIMKHVGEGGKTVSDRIPLSLLSYAKGIKSTSLKEYLNVAYVACGTVAAGQQYILRANVRQFVGMADEETFGVCADYKAKSGDVAKNILANLAIAFVKNLSKQIWPLFNVYVTTLDSGSSTAFVENTNYWKVTTSSVASTLAANALKGIIIEAAPQDYRRGILAQENVYFDVTANKVISAGEETAWATITANAANDRIAAAILNNNKIKDLEYFCMGERGDIYRGIGWPNNIDTAYMVDDQTYGWDIIELGFAYQGPAEDIQKSNKEIVIAIPAPSSYTSSCESYKILADINTAAGSTVITQVFGS